MNLLDPEKKKSGLVVAIMKKLKNGKEVEETKVEELDKPDYDEGYRASVDEMFDAIKAEDKPKFKHALKNFIKMCVDSEED